MRIIAKRKVADTAKVLMVISITLLVYGIVLGITTNHTLIDPVKDVEVVNPEDSTISITPSNGNEVVNDNGGTIPNTNSGTNNRINDKEYRKIQERLSELKETKTQIEIDIDTRQSFKTYLEGKKEYITECLKQRGNVK